ncbi:MAG: hypothetical protein PHP31_01250 [Lentimicrobiaceae bacterium]|nr:hypothetical protein [Lentimicrobiaceae bacterium]
MTNNNEITIRPANKNDIPFIAKVIINAEKGMGATVSYCRLFEISEAEFYDFLVAILEINLPNYEFSMDSYGIAVQNNKSVACCGAWVEGIAGISSSMLKINAFKKGFSKEKMNVFYKNIGDVENLSFKRVPNVIQLEYMYIEPEVRGHNLPKMFVDYHINRLKHLGAEKMHGYIIEENVISVRAMQKAGMKIIGKITDNNPKVAEYYNGNSRLLLEIEL